MVRSRHGIFIATTAGAGVSLLAAGVGALLPITGAPFAWWLATLFHTTGNELDLDIHRRSDPYGRGTDEEDETDI